MFQQREVLHVARADLDHVGPFGDQREGFVVDGLGDDAQSEFIPDFGHDPQRFKAEALECVRRCARLVGAAAEELRAGGRYLLGDGEGLFAAFDRARTGDNGQRAAADGGIGAGEADDGVFFLDVAAGEFVGLGNPDHVGNAGKIFEVAAVDFTLVAGDADGGALGSGERMGAKTQLLNMVADRLNLFRRGLRLHDD